MARLPAYIGIGSNLDDPLRQLHKAVEHLFALRGGELSKVSAFYRNPAMRAPGQPQQPDFLNAVARIDTELEPYALLAQLQAIEQGQNRRREEGVRWGARTLDLDLLVYAHSQLHEQGLQIPHPGLGSRPFVVFPLAEIEPQLVIPGLGWIGDLAAQLDSAQLQRIASPSVGLSA